MKNHLRARYCNQCGKRLNDSRAPKDDDGRAKLYADIAHPINSACREMIQEVRDQRVSTRRSSARSSPATSRGTTISTSNTPTHRAAKAGTFRSTALPSSRSAAHRHESRGRLPMELRKLIFVASRPATAAARHMVRRPGTDSFGAGIFPEVSSHRPSANVVDHSHWRSSARIA